MTLGAALKILMAVGGCYRTGAWHRIAIGRADSQLIRAEVGQWHLIHCSEEVGGLLVD